MTNQVAITMLKNLEQSLDDYCELNDEGKTAFSMAITALELFGNSEQLASAQPQWIPCSERLPEERDSIFAKLYGTEKWRDVMFRKISDTVICTVQYRDGTRQTALCHIIDGEWNQSMTGMGKVLAWMPLPPAYKGGEEE